MLYRSDWNLLVLAAAEGEPLSPAQYQKSLFLLGRAYPTEIAGGSYYDFEPYNYGPFDAAVYSDADELERRGLVQISRSQGGWKEYAATSAGLARASELERGVPPKVADYIRRVVTWARGLSFADLVRAVYNSYPEMKANSIFKG
jgi:hypothetical protein